MFELDKTGALESAVISHAESVVIRSARLATIEKGGGTLALQADEGARWDRVEMHGYCAGIKEAKNYRSADSCLCRRT
ncbi:MAG: hypothetical protein WC205_03030 [Opitutaceae bacterium]